MSGRRWFIASLFVSLALIAGAVPDAGAIAAPTDPQVVAPTVPGPAPSDAPPGVPVQKAPLTHDGSDVVVPAGGSRDASKDAPVKEIVGDRSASTESWLTADGRKVLHTYSEPQYFQPSGQDGFVPIDNRLVDDPKTGGLVTAGNAWQVHFGATADLGVSYVVDGHTVTTAPADAEGAKASPAEVVSESKGQPAAFGVSTTGNQVVYPDVWPGVDVRYTVTNSAVKEELIIKTAEALARSSYSFAVAGGSVVDGRKGAGWKELSWDGSDKAGFRVEFPPLTVQNYRGDAAVDAKPQLSIADAGRALDGSVLSTFTATVDPGWLAAQDGMLPVVVDPSTEIAMATSTWASYSNDGASYGTSYGQIIGNSRAFGANQYWRSVSQFDLSPIKSVNGRVTSARIDLSPSSAHWTPSSYYMGIYGGFASAWSYAGASPGWNWSFPGGVAQNVVHTGDAPDGSAVYGPGGIYGNGGNYGRIWLGDLIDWFVDPAGGNVNWAAIGVSSQDVAGQYTFRESQESLWVGYDVQSAPANLVAPADQATVVTGDNPTLSVNGLSDADSGESPPYTFFVVSTSSTPVVADPRGFCNVGSQIVSSGWLGRGTQTWNVPGGVLQDGTTYYWGVITVGRFAGAPTCSPVRSFKLDRRTGLNTPSPTESVGAATVNLATGNAVISTGSKSVNSLAGALGMSFTYNSQAQSTQGLKGYYYWNQANTNVGSPTISDGAPVMQRVDSSVNFDWQTGPPAANLSSLIDWFDIHWTGYVTAQAAGSYVFGGSSDDDLWINIAGSQVFHSACCAGTAYGSGVTFLAGETKKIDITYKEYTGYANVHVFAKLSGAGGDPFLENTFAVNTQPQPLSTGWHMSAGGGSYVSATVHDLAVTLTQDDGSSEEYTRPDINTTTFKAPVGSSDLLTRNSDGTLQLVTGDNTTYTFNADGLLTSVVSGTDDRAPSATTYSWSYPAGIAQLTAITDPVSARTATLTYSGSGTCPTPPSGFDSPTPGGKLCKIDFSAWGAGTTDLFYSGARLARVLNSAPTAGDQITDFGYTGNLINYIRDPLANDAVTAGVRTSTPLSNDPVATLISYDGSSRVTGVQLPQPNASTPPARPSETFAYDSAPVGVTNGQSTVHVAGTSEPNGYAKRVTFDNSYRQITASDAAAHTTTQAWDGATDRVSYVDSPDGLRTSTIYDPTVQFNTAGKPVETWGPAPTSWFSGATPTGGHGAADVAHTTTSYDGGIVGLKASYWLTPDFAGAPKLHATGVYNGTGAVDHDWGYGNPIDSSPTGWGLQLDGWLDLSQTGTYTFDVKADGVVSLSVDGVGLLNNLDGSDPNSFADYSTTRAIATAGKHRVSLRFANKNGDAKILFTMGQPNGVWVEPTSGFTPDYGLVTSTTSPNSTGTGTSTTTNTSYQYPENGLATATVVDPSGLALTTSATYEAPGTSGGFLRKKTSTLPAGSTSAGATVYAPGSSTDQAATVKYDYYGSTEAGPTGTGCSGVATNQAGLAKKTTSADPDGTGSQTPIVQEVAYDQQGRVVASHYTTDSAWTCTTYDDRGRVTSVVYPAFTNPADSSLNTPARTVTNTYSVGGNPLVSQTSDPSGTVKSTVDLLGRVTDYVDSSGYTTHNDYDAAGRLTTSTIKNGGGTTVETLAYTFNTTGNGVNQLNTESLDGTVQATVTYDSLGRATSVAYANGTSKAVGFDTNYQRVISTTSTLAAGATVTDAVTRNPITGQIVDQTVDGTDVNSGANFAYDAAGRLTAWWAGDPGTGNKYNGTYRYDGYDSTPSGCVAQYGRNTNRLQQRLKTYNSGGTLTADTTDTSCYDNADRLTGYNPAAGANPFSSLTYDSHGNVVTMGGETHGYDSANRHLVTRSATGGGGITAPTVVATSKVQAASGTSSWTVPKPTGLAVGDVVVVAVTHDASLSSYSPSGWGYTDYEGNWSVSPGMVIETYTKKADSTDVAGTGWTFGLSASPSNTSTSTAIAVRGADTTGANPYSDGAYSSAGTGGRNSSSSSSGTATSLASGQVTSTQANDLSVTITGSNVNGVTFTPGSGYTEQQDTSYGTGRNLEIATKTLTTAGASGSPTVTTSTGSGLSAIHLTLKGISSGGSTTTVTYVRDVADRITSRTVNGTVQERYAYTASADTPSLTLNSSGAVIERTVSLPGGVLLTTRAAGNVWSYPNLHGDIVATTNQAGVKQGATRGYDPYGNPLGTTTTPDNSDGNLDYGWHGQQQRPQEHETGLTPITEMGARQYSALLGRFIEVDPIPGGTGTNDYGYVADPTNSADLNGMGGCGACHRSVKSLAAEKKQDRLLLLAKSQCRSRTPGACEYVRVANIAAAQQRERGIAFLGIIVGALGVIATGGTSLILSLASVGISLQQTVSACPRGTKSGCSLAAIGLVGNLLSLGLGSAASSIGSAINAGAISTEAGSAAMTWLEVNSSAASGAGVAFSVTAEGRS